MKLNVDWGLNMSRVGVTQKMKSFSDDYCVWLVLILIILKIVKEVNMIYVEA